MFKTCRTFIIGILAMGLFIGSSSLINPSIASAATTFNTQPIITYHSVIGGQQKAQMPTNDQAMRDLSKQFYQRPYQSYNSIVTQAAKLMKVSNQVVLKGLNRGNTLVEIAVRHGIYRSSILTKLNHLQRQLDYTNAVLNYNNDRRPLFNRPVGPLGPLGPLGPWNAPNYDNTNPGFGHNLFN